MTLARQCLLVARKDLRLELRAGEALFVTAPFGAVALLFVPAAVGADGPLLRSLGPGLYWVVVLLFGVLVTLRQSAVDGGAQLDLLRLSGVAPVARLGGAALANAALLLVFEAILAPVAIVLYDPDLTGWPWLVPVLPLVAAGLALLGALTSELARGLAGRTALGPLLAAPVALPILLGATQTLDLAGYGESPWPWLLLLLTADALVALAMVLVARHLEEST